MAREVEQPVLVQVTDHEKSERSEDAVVLNEAERVDENGVSADDGGTFRFETDELSPFVICEVEQVSVEVAAAMPEQSFEAQTGDVTVRAEAPAGAFAVGTTMTVEPIDSSAVYEQVDAAIKKDAGANTAIKSLTAVDIKFFDASGSEVEPARPIAVRIVSNIVRDIEQPVLVHVDEQAEAASVVSTQLENSSGAADEGAEDTLLFDSTQFSPYVIVEVETISTQVITARGETYEVSVSYGHEAALPEGAKLQASEITEKDEQYDTYAAQAAEAVGNSPENLTHLRLFEISIVSPAGDEVEPAASVEVKIEYKGDAIALSGQDIQIVHLGHKGTDVIEPETEGKTTEKADTFTFVTDSFSVFSVVSSGATTDLNGKTFALINTYTNNAMQNTHTNNNTRLAQQAVSIVTSDGNTYVRAKQAPGPSSWTFTSAEGGRYYIKDSNGLYLNVHDNVVTTSTTPQALDVEVGTGTRAGKLRITDGQNHAINNYDNGKNGFGEWSDNGNNEWFTLFELKDSAYTAEKISVQELHEAQGGVYQEVLIYKSVFNAESGRFEDYVIDGYGNLVRAHDKGDSVALRSVVSPKWQVIVYRDATTGELNGCYDFYNEETGMYLCPKSDGTLVSSTKPGVTLNGRRDGGYNSTIETWDSSAMAWYGYQIGDGDTITLSVGTGDESQAFSFADCKPETTGVLHPVDTVDSTAAGISIKMYNFANWNTIDDVMGKTEYTHGNISYGRVSDTLTDNGFPVFTTSGKNAANLFGGNNYKGDGNHLFLESIYDSTGYYEYNAFNNFAHYDPSTGNFTVYEETATPSNGNNFYYQRGNFFPFNTIDPNNKATNQNLYDGSGSELEVSDPALEGDLYYINNPDYYFGVVAEATFYMPKDGMENGGPVVYEFNGDDDLWIYIDGVLILDIGGVHDAIPGSINFATGEIDGQGAGGATTIKGCFKNAGVFPDGTAWDDTKVDLYFKGDTFVDYGSHNFKMFYMEHGAGASNLEMRFNLPVIERGKFTVEKELKNTDQQSYANVSFAYQAFKKVEGHDVPLTSAVYEGTTNPITFYDNVIVNGQSYDNVFYLKPGESATFDEMAEDIEYYVQEIAVRTDYYDEVIVNDVKIDGEDTQASDGGIFKAPVAKVGNRARVIYQNSVSEKNNNDLRITKKLAEGQIDTGATFEFRVQLEKEDGTLGPYSTGIYYIVDDEGTYYRYENGVLVSNGMTPFAYRAGNNGTIANIPANYTVLIEGLLAGTDFHVEEIRNPAGWVMDQKVVEEGTYEASTLTGKGFVGDNITADGQIKLDTDAKVTITNKAGLELTVNKAWESGDFVTAHGSISVALYDADEVLVPGTVKTIAAPSTSTTYVLPNLTLYHVREVVVNGEIVTPVEPNRTIAVSGETTTLGSNATNTYVVTYGDVAIDQSDTSKGSVTVTNTMPTLKMVKYNTDESVTLDGAVFKLTDASGATIPCMGSLVSGSDGVFVDATRLSNGTYYLVETTAPKGYNLPEDKIKITVGESLNPVITAEDDSTATLHKVYENKSESASVIEYHVTNNAGTELPMTGGPGTHLFTLVGVALIAGALAYGIISKRLYIKRAASL